MLNEGFNLAFGTLLIPTVKLMGLVGLVLSTFAVIRLRGELNTGSLLLMPLVGIGTASLLVPISLVMSSSYKISLNFERILTPLIKQKLTNRETKEGFARQLKSCPLIRCKIGNMYYMEARAQLTMLDSTVNGLVFLLVRTKS